MQAFLSLGRWFFAIPFAILGLFHFFNGTDMAGMIPWFLPAKIVWIYVTGAALIAATVSMLIGRYDKLATVLLAFFLLLIVATVRLPDAISGSYTSRESTSLMLKDLALAGAAMMYALNYAKDRSVIG